MELNVPKLSNPLFLSLLVIFFSLVIWLKLAKGRAKLNLPPSPPKLPLIGNIHQLGKLPHRSFLDLSRKYGSLLLLQLGHNPTLLVSSVEIVEEIVKNHDIVFSNRLWTTAAKIMFYGCTNDLGFAPYSDYWRQVRKISVVELLSLRRVHSFQFVRDKEVEDLINKINRASVKGESINLSEEMIAVSNNITSRCVLSRKTEGTNGSNKFGQLSRRFMVLFTRFCFGDMFPYLWWMDVLTGSIPSMKAISREIDVFLDQIIEEHRALKDHDEDIKKDFVSVILQLQTDGLLEMHLTQDNIKTLLLDMLLGGTDTSSNTLEWSMAELIKHPNLMKKLQEEVRNVVGNKAKVEFDDINRMKYLKCVIKETLRLHPPVPFLVPRKTTSSVKLGGFDIPSDVTVIVNAFAIQRDPNLWDKPEEFIPERFEVESPVDYNKNHDFKFIPFGFGRRGCPGWIFALASVECVIANLLYWFDWKLSAGEVAQNLDMSELYGLVVHKKVPIRVLPVSHFST